MLWRGSRELNDRARFMPAECLPAFWRHAMIDLVFNYELLQLIWWVLPGVSLIGFTATDRIGFDVLKKTKIANQLIC